LADADIVEFDRSLQLGDGRSGRVLGGRFGGRLFGSRSRLGRSLGGRFSRDFGRGFRRGFGRRIGRGGGLLGGRRLGGSFRRGRRGLADARLDVGVAVGGAELQDAGLGGVGGGLATGIVAGSGLVQGSLV